MWDDVLTTCRRLRSSAGTTLAIVLLIAITIAGNACVFAVAYGLMTKALPFPAEQRLATLTVSSSKAGGEVGWSVPYQETVARETRTLGATAAYKLKEIALADDHGRYTGMTKAIMVQPALYPLLGVRPTLGRLLVADDATIGAPPSAVISWDFWKSRFGGSRSVLERSVRIESRDHRIVGVLPEGFGFPQRDRQVSLPLVFTEEERSSANAFSFWTALGAVGRLKPGHSMSDASTEMMRLARSEPSLQRIADEISLELRAQPLRYRDYSALTLAPPADDLCDTTAHANATHPRAPDVRTKGCAHPPVV